MKNLFLFLIILLTSLVVADMYWWIKTALEIEGFENVLKEYLSIFPLFIRDGHKITYISLMTSGSVIGLSLYMAIKRYYFIVSIIFLSLNSLLFGWTLFSLM